jgi:hypothetical protein
MITDYGLRVNLRLLEAGPAAVGGLKLEAGKEIG